MDLELQISPLEHLQELLQNEENGDFEPIFCSNSFSKTISGVEKAGERRVFSPNMEITQKNDYHVKPPEGIFENKYLE